MTHLKRQKLLCYDRNITNTTLHMSSVSKCQALHIVKSNLWYFYLNKVIFAILDVSSLHLQKCRTSIKVFYINICGFISRYKFLYETRVLDNSYLRFKVKLPTSDSTKITARGPKVPIEGPVLLDAP